MDLLLAICQAIGIGVAVGIGGPLVALFVSFMASMEAGIDPRGSDWKFLGETWFLVVLLLANVVGFYLDRSANESARRGFQVLIAGAFGAIAGAASLAEEGEPAALGLILPLSAGAAQSWDNLQQGATWVNAFVDHGLTKRMAVWFDGHWRRDGLGAEPQQLLLRPGVQVTLRRPTSRDRAVSAAAPQRAPLPLPQRCSASGASMPASRTVLPSIRSVSAPLA